MSDISVFLKDKKKATPNVKVAPCADFKDENGNDDEVKFQLASSMLAYINASSIGMNDGMDYVEECLNAAECRNIFEMIFTSMNQKQHYDMMMGSDNQ